MGSANSGPPIATSRGSLEFVFEIRSIGKAESLYLSFRIVDREQCEGMDLCGAIMIAQETGKIRNLVCPFDLLHEI
jgi:hypothetical protein